MKLTTRGREVAEAIRDRKVFTTHGALYSLDAGVHYWCSGQLSGEDLEAFQRDVSKIDYTVFSYNTPIAWHTPEGWHRVSQRFSVTTSKHQGKLYLI